MHSFTELTQWANDCESDLRLHEIERKELSLEKGVLKSRSENWELAEGWPRLAEAVGAPSAYLMRLNEPVRENLLNFHLTRGDHLHDSNLMLAEQQGRFVGFLRSDLQILSVGQVLDAISTTIGDGASSILVNRRDWTNCGFEIEFVTPRIAREVAAGDVLQAGLTLRHSALGRFATSIEVFVLRLVCSNGLTRRQCVRRGAITRTRRLPSDQPQATKLQLNQVRKLVANVWEQLPSSLAAIERLTDSPVDVEGVITQYLSRSRMLSKRLRDVLRAAWVRGGSIQTASGALNALTQAATHNQSLSRLQRRALSRLAGVLANSETHICPHCFSVLGAV
jgi:uncharacterized protein DUF932